MIDRLGSMDALRSQMRKWTPQQLQAFAMQHQNDAIALSLVSQEQSEREKSLASQQAMGQTQKPKVNQQVIGKLAQLPEEVGIGQLPAQNLEEGMADGGIVGYASGSLIGPSSSQGASAAFARFLESMGSSAREFMNADSATQKMFKDQFAKETQGPRFATPPQAAAPAVSEAAPASRLAAASVPTAVAGIGSLLSAGAANALSNATPEQREQLTADVGSDTPLAAAIMNAAKPREESAESPYAGRGRVNPPLVTPEDESSKEIQKLAQDRGITQGRGMQTGQPTQSTMQAATKTVDDLYAGAKRDAGVGALAVDPYATQRAEIEANRKEQATRELEGIGKREEGLAALMKSKEDRLAAREGKIGEQEESDRNMAIIKAGLALATSTKKGFLSAVAEGATAGVNDLLKSKSLTKAERQKIEDAREAMDTLRFDQGELTRKEKITAQNKIDEVGNIAKEQTILALMAREGISRQEAKDRLEASVRIYEGAKRDEAAIRAQQISASAPTATMKEVNALRAANPSLSYEDALQKVKMTPAASVKGVMTLDQASDNVRRDLENYMLAPTMQAEAIQALKAKGIQKPTSMDIKDYLVDREMRKSSTATSTMADPRSPAAGTIMNGYKFKGGNPADKSNWEKV